MQIWAGPPTRPTRSDDLIRLGGDSGYYGDCSAGEQIVYRVAMQLGSRFHPLRRRSRPLLRRPASSSSSGQYKQVCAVMSYVSI
jgi:hypothetical protein